MKHISAIAIATLVLINCRPNHPAPPQQTINVKITDEKGTPVKEAHSGQTLILSSQRFSVINPNGISPNLAQIYFDNVPVPFQQEGPNAVRLQVPVMLLHDYKELVITIRINQAILQVIQRIFYQPTVTGEVLSGNDGTFQMPAEMAIDGYGDLYVIDQRSGHDVVLKVTPTGTTSVFAGGAGEFGRLVGIGIDVVTLRMFLADATAQQIKVLPMVTPSAVSVFAGSGIVGNTDGPSGTATFRFGTERVDNFSTNELGQGLHVDMLGNVYVGEQYGTAFGGRESQIRKITPGGNVTTIAGSRITMPTGPEVLHPVAGVTIVPATGEVAYIGGSSSWFQGLTRITVAGAQVRVAGKVSNENMIDGTGAAAEFAFPKALSYYNTFYHVADGSNGAYRRVTQAGNVITLAGVGHFATPSFCSCGITGPRDSSYVMPSIFDGNPDKYKLRAKAIIMDQVGGIAVRSNNLLYLTDYGTNFKCVWKIRIE